MDLLKIEITELQARIGAYVQQYENASDDLKLNLLKFLTALQEQLVQLERQKTILIERTPSPLDSRPTTPAAFEPLSPPPKRKRVDDEESTNIQAGSKIVEHCKGYMHYFLLERQNSGKFIEGSVRKCVTVFSEKFALTAGHCIPNGLPNNYPFNVYDSQRNTYVVNAVKVCKPEDQGDDYSILKVIQGKFANVPEAIALPYDGGRYFVLGYDAEYPGVSELSCFSGSFRNTNIFANKSYVIGSPGTTDGCSGGGVFNKFGRLYGICVAGKLDWTNAHTTLSGHLNSLNLKLSQPSYSHIVPVIYCTSATKEL